MRHLLRALVLLLAASSILPACKKNNSSDNSTLIKHRWQIISLNGEVYRYVGKPSDYFDFGNDTLIEYIGGQYDTATYQLTNNGHTLNIHPLTTSIGQQTLNIRTLTDTQLILSGGTTMPPINILDSLSR